MRSKTIRVEEKVYEGLDALRDWKETYSQVIERLLKLHGTMSEVKDILGPGHYLMERPGGEVPSKR